MYMYTDSVFVDGKVILERHTQLKEREEDKEGEYNGRERKRENEGEGEGGKYIRRKRKGR